MALLVFILAVPVVFGFRQDNAGLSKVPHDSIPVDATAIRLNNNYLTGFTEYEFSNYHKLTILDVSGNLLSEVSATAFSGTKLKTLDMAHNSLTAFPDLCSINETLEKLFLGNNTIHSIAQERLDCLVRLQVLSLKNNQLQTSPDVSLVGSDVCAGFSCLFSITVSSHLSNTSFCHFERFAMVELVTITHVPLINCSGVAPVQLKNIYLERNGYSDLTDLTNLTSFVGFPHQVSLSMEDNGFGSFPDLPPIMRGKLLRLRLSHNHISLVNSELLIGLELDELDLTANELVSVPGELLYVAGRLILEQNPLGPPDSYAWNLALCDPRSHGLQELFMAESLGSVENFPDVSAALATRNATLTIDLTLTDVPCEWSVGWMQEAQLSGQANFVLDALPCYAQSWELYDEETPDNFLITKEFVADWFLIRGHAFLWHVYSSPTKSLAEPHWILGEGTYTHHHGYVLEEADFVGAYYNVTGIGAFNDATCWSPYTLADGRTDTCVNVTEDVTRVTLSRSWTDDEEESAGGRLGRGGGVSLVTVTTRHLPCWLDFHVTVGVGGVGGRCGWQRCERVGRVLGMREEGEQGELEEVSSCTFQCPHSEEWHVRLVPSPHHTATAITPQLCELIPELISSPGGK